MVESGLVTSETRSIEVADALVRRTYYAIVPSGTVAHRLTLGFYNARQQIAKALAEMIDLVDDTARHLEQESPGLAEVGYWRQEQKDAYVRAKRLLELPGEPS